MKSGGKLRKRVSVVARPFNLLQELSIGQYIETNGTAAQLIQRHDVPKRLIVVSEAVD